LDRLIKPNHIYQEDCIAFMQKMRGENVFVDVIVTSPPYNKPLAGSPEKAIPGDS
jgi:DNA modification methylase